MRMVVPRSSSDEVTGRPLTSGPDRVSDGGCAQAHEALRGHKQIRTPFSMKKMMTIIGVAGVAPPCWLAAQTVALRRSKHAVR
jgi:hypothetical protein